MEIINIKPPSNCAALNYGDGAAVECVRLWIENDLRPQLLSELGVNMIYSVRCLEDYVELTLNMDSVEYFIYCNKFYPMPTSAPPCCNRC